ncbi:MAG TPA: NAD(P)/FAD-dependent oxidoreductase, partial [Phycisphaerales bacterium]|nr:NAD(P)/FAD-dependent oxidoreductase [Phycisphaerales bacterium]
MSAFDAFQPATYQPPLPLDRLIAAPRSLGSEDDVVEVDVLFVGGGAAGLAGAIRLAQIAAERGISDMLQIAVLEKAERPGDHCLSGAVINPVALRELLPDVPVADLPLRGVVEQEKFYFLSGGSAFRLPVPPTMHNKGCHVASLCEVVRFLAERAEAIGVHMLAGYPAETLLIEDRCVKGVRTAPTGRERDGSPGPSYHPPTEVRAKLTVLCEGARGPLSQAWLACERIGSDNPQIYALGVKELWRVKTPLREVIHTVGWPVPHDTFGGGWMYPMSEDLVSLGLVVGLDSPYADLDPHGMMQRLKSHPLVQQYLEGGELQEWGAKIIPEGGYHALPHRLGGHGVLLAGDAAGLVNVASLKGVHYAMRSGMAAAEAAF